MSVINSNIKYKGVSFHIQTQDKGTKANYIESLIFREGKLLSARKTPYVSLLDKPDLKKRIQELMKTQHQSIIQDLSGGKMDHFLTITDSPESEKGKKSKSITPLKIKLANFSFSSMTEPIKLSLEVKNKSSSKPVSNAKITVSAIQESGVKYLLYLGETRRDGRLDVSCSLPRSTEEKFTLSINAEKEGFEEHEMKILLEKT